MKNCERCGSKFEGTGTQKYCCDICRDLAALKRKYGADFDHIFKTCSGNCCKSASRNIYNGVKGWVLVQKRGFGVKAGAGIVYCPFCGGRLEK